MSSLREISTYQAGVAQSTANRLLGRLTDAALKEHGITTMQWFIIGTIYDTGTVGIGVTQLSKIVDTNVPYITNTLNLLEHKGMINRRNRQGDNRSKVVTIAPSFISTVDKIEADLRQKMREAIYDDVTPEELLTYVSVLQKLGNSLSSD